MNFEEYSIQRKALMNEVDTLLEDGNVEAAEAKMKDVEKLDQKWDTISAAKANARALNGQARAMNITDPGKDPQTGAVEVMSDNLDNMDAKDLYKTQAYTDAWTKTMMGKPLTAQEAKVYEMANAYTHTTENTGDVIPETVANGIWSEVEDMYPYFADVSKTYVNGILSIIKATETTDAAWYDEATATEDGTETFATVKLSGCELARAITVSWKLKEMAMEDFIPYIQRRMAERMGAGLGYGVTNGQGPDAEKPEPTGIITALKADATSQVVEYTQGALTYANVTAARALIKSGYSNGLKIYANAATIWGVLANVVDDNGRPIFINNQATDGMYRMLGIAVAEDASLADGDILISNASRGYQANINKQISIATEDHVKARTTDYAGYAIVDGAPLTYYAHALLTVATA